MARSTNLFIVTIDGKAYELAFTTIKGVSYEFPELSYTALRETFRTGTEHLHVKSGKVYRVSRAIISRVKGRGGHLNKNKPQKSVT